MPFVGLQQLQWFYIITQHVIIKLLDINFNRELAVVVAILTSMFIAYLITYKIEPPFQKIYF